MASCLVLGYDRTDSARLAAKWAIAQLQPGGRLVIVHSCRPLHAPPAPSSERERSELGRAVVDELLLEGEDAVFDLDVKVEIDERDPVTALVDATERYGAEGIVVGSEHRSRVRTAIGTVTVELLRVAPAPVIVVPPTAAARALSRAAATER
jgi:nucleotide-binding universal stress UspA family protein